MADIIVNDESYAEMPALFSSVAETMEERISDYIAILDDVILNGVVSGFVHDNLVLFKNKVSILEGHIKTCVEEVNQLCTSFVESVDEADCELY